MNQKNDVYGLMVNFLCNLKNLILEADGEEIRIRTGCLASARYIDTAINTMMTQQTQIASLKSQLECEKAYSAAWGDFAGFTPQELNKEQQEELRACMKVFEKKWKAEE